MIPAGSNRQSLSNVQGRTAVAKIVVTVKRKVTEIPVLIEGMSLWARGVSIASVAASGGCCELTTTFVGATSAKKPIPRLMIGQGHKYPGRGFEPRREFRKVAG